MNNRIKEWRDKKGWSLQKLGDAAGATRQQIHKLENGHQQLNLKWMKQLAQALDCSPEDLLPLEDTAAVETSMANVDLSRIITDGVVREKDLPVFASAAGGDGQTIITYEPIEYVKRPFMLMNVKSGFAMYVICDSMAPKYRTGDMLLVHPMKPPRQGDFVLVVLKNGDSDEHEALVKQLIKIDDNTLTLQQFNPPHRLSIERDKVKNILKIVGNYEAP